MLANAIGCTHAEGRESASQKYWYVIMSSARKSATEMPCQSRFGFGATRTTTQQVSTTSSAREGLSITFHGVS
ncbi:hypothetical protein D3C72_2282470 [compost metagenome]